LARHVPIIESAVLAEEAGFDSVWVSDHVVMLREHKSAYPFAPDGKMTWDPEDPWHDPLIALAACAGATERVELGMAVLIAPLRNPIILAKQLASLDALSGGRLVVGAGAGWLAEEYDVLDVDFTTRGERLDEWIDIMRDCWTGAPEPKDYGHYRIPEGVLTYPTPARPVPILIGGMTPSAISRTGRLGDGWVALQHIDDVNLDVLRAGMTAIAAEAERNGRTPPNRTVLRLAGPSPSIARRLEELADVGVTDVVIDVRWDGDGPGRTLETVNSRAFRRSLPEAGQLGNDG
jgi:probable F420-dependent oxidoreductase